MQTKEVRVEKIVISAKAGASVCDFIREGLLIAITEWNNVELSHNGKKYSIKPNDLFESVKEIG
jgi:hypothetical protein